MENSCCKYGLTLTISVAIFSALALADELPTCQPKDFHYEYTECDAYGGRWRVSVPDPHKCIGGAPNPPVRGKDCTYTCPPGNYLNITGDQDCHKCPEGTYSMGGGVRYENWSKLPQGFNVRVESYSSLGSSHQGNQKKPFKCTEKNGWSTKGEFIASLASHCKSSLVYTANLVKPGKVSFTYQYTDKNTVFRVLVQNDQCASSSEASGDKWPRMTSEGQWKTQTIELKKGLNVITWRTISLQGDESKQTRTPVLIKNIEVSGVAFTSECTKCLPGTYSSEGSADCQDCPKNTYSPGGAGKCKPCDVKTQYSGQGASECTDRPACTSNDYFGYLTACDENNQTQKMYKWAEHKLCRTDVAGSAKLPASGVKEECPPCNPGMHYTQQSCQFCPKNTFSDGREACQPCPVNSAPKTGLVYKWWNTMPPNMTASCISTDDTGCSTKNGWQPANDHIHTGVGHADDAYLILLLDVDGFQGREGIFHGKPVEIARITFVFELDCAENADDDTACQMYFMQESRSMGASVIKAWQGKTSKQQYTAIITKTEPVSFSWAFQKTTFDSAFRDGKVQYKRTGDVARIYSINITNTLTGGAAECVQCPRTSDADGCVPCPDGQYISSESMSCVQCPPNTVINSNHAFGRESCQPCGEGLKTDDHKTCYSDCLYTGADGKQFNFTSLSGVHDVSGGFLFTSSGTQYLHNFQLLLCPAASQSHATCQNNITLQQMESWDMDNVVEAMVCRSTVIPPKTAGGKTLSAQPVSLGDTLTQISMDKNLTATIKELQYRTKDDDIFIHFVYNSISPTLACPNGRSTVVTLQCDPKEDGNGTMELPPKCPDGTCDGCTFHILWRTRWACPSCREADYREVKGECIKGLQKITYIAPVYCLLSGNHKNLESHQKCQVLRLDALTNEMKIIIGLIVGGVVLLGAVCLISLCYCWKKNRKLEYKYMKLVAGGDGKDGELPAPPQCIDSEDEENDHFDAVEFKERGGGLLGKIKSMTGSKDRSHNFETIHLTDRSDSTI